MSQKVRFGRAEAKLDGDTSKSCVLKRERNSRTLRTCMCPRRGIKSESIVQAHDNAFKTFGDPLHLALELAWCSDNRLVACGAIGRVLKMYKTLVRELCQDE